MRRKLLIFSLVFLMIGLLNLSSQVRAKTVLAKRPQLKQLPPKIQVQKFSGDFAKWVTILQVDIKSKLRFRWLPRYSQALYALVLVRSGSVNGRVIKRQKLVNIPKSNTWGQFFMNPFQSAGKQQETLYVTVRLWKSAKQPSGPASLGVRIMYKKPSTVVTQFHLDTLRVVRVSPQGSITGPPSSSSQLNESNSLKITYYYDLVTENNAEIRQWLVLKKGSVAHHNFWYVKHIPKKGRGQVTNLATIRCQKPNQGRTKIYGIKYKLLHNGKTLKEGLKMFNKPIVFRCPNSPTFKLPKLDILMVKDIKPGNGASLYGPFSDKFTTSNSLKITYKYTLNSRKKAEIRQWALKANGSVAANNYWNYAKISKGSGEVINYLTIKCKSSNQSDTVIKYILVKLIDPVSHKVIRQFKKSVNYTFKCEKPGEIK